MIRAWRSDFGVAVLIAILVSLMAFTASSVIALQLRHDMRTAQLGAKQVSRRIAVKGAVNHLLSMLRRGEGTEYDSESPLILSIGDVEEISVWTVPDPIFPDITHIQAEAGGISFTKTVVNQLVRDSKEYFEDNNVVYSKKPEDSSWNTLPTPPTTAYNILGQNVTIELHPVGSAEISDIEASEDGQLVVTVFQPDPSTGFQGVHVWDDDAQTWTTLPPLQSFSFGPGGLEPGSSYQTYQVDGMTEGKIYSVTSGGLAVYDLDEGQWNFFTTPSTGYREKFAAAGGGKLAIAMKDPFSSNRWLNVFEDGSWSNLPIGPASQLAHLELTPRGINADGEIYGTKYDPNTLSWRTQVFKDGSWQMVNTPPEVSGLELRDVDAAGALVFSNGNSSLQVWSQKQDTVELMSAPAGAQILGSAGFEGRPVAGGGAPVQGAPPELKVVSSF